MVISCIHRVSCVSAVGHILCVGHADRLRMYKLYTLKMVHLKLQVVLKDHFEKLWQYSSLRVSSRPGPVYCHVNIPCVCQVEGSIGDKTFGGSLVLWD